MKDEKLDRLLDDLKRESVPDPPGNLESRVLRTIRIAGAESLGGEFFLPFSFSVVLRYAAVVAIVATGLGMMFGTAITRTAAPDPVLAAREALSFDVFGPESMGLPHHFTKE
jgi:hypothetical protein